MVWSVFAAVASAASCVPEPLPFQVEGAADVFAVTLVEERAGTLFPTVVATVDAVYAGCTSPGDTIELLFHPDDDLRPAWVLGGHYVVATSEAAGDQHTYTFCDLFVSADALSPEDRAWLEGRPVVCGGVTTCQDAAPPAACEDTCGVVSCPGATCAVNPCGACALELLDADGVLQGDADADGVCDPADACPGDDRADDDADGVCDDLDACAGGDDGNDVDGNGVPDACDPPDAHSGTAPTTTPTEARPSLGGAGGCRCDGGGGGSWLAGAFALSTLRRGRPRGAGARGTRGPSAGAAPRG